MGKTYFMFLVLLSVVGVFGAEADPPKTIELAEGDSVKLETCVTKIQRDDELEWKFGPHVIATIKANNALLYDTDDALFKDKLHLDDQTGDLTINNTRIKLSGRYEVKIVNINHTIHKSHIVTVLDAIPKKVSVTEGDSAILKHDIADIEIYDVIMWMFEDEETSLAQINKKTTKTPSYDETDDRFRGRLDLNQTGYLTITNTKSTDAGLYKLKVTGQNKAAKYRKFRVTVSEAGLSTGGIVGICVGVAALLALPLLVVGIIWYRKPRQPDEGTGEPLNGGQL